MTNKYILIAMLILILAILALIVGENYSNLNMSDAMTGTPKAEITP